MSWCAKGVTFAPIKTNMGQQKRAPGGRATAKKFALDIERTFDYIKTF